MTKKFFALALFLTSLLSYNSFANCTTSSNQNCSCQKPVAQPCCDSEGVSYCDSSAGHLVCNSGGYSQCLCTRTAIANVQGVTGCCTWHGGVLKVDLGTVICADGSVSSICSIQNFENPYPSS